MTIPASITNLIPEMVTEVSAIFVDTMTFLLPCGNTFPHIFLDWFGGIFSCISRIQRTVVVKLRSILVSILTGGVFWKTLSCCGAGSAAYRGNTIKLGPTMDKNKQGNYTACLKIWTFSPAKYWETFKSIAFTWPFLSSLDMSRIFFTTASISSCPVRNTKISSLQFVWWMKRDS